MQQDEGFEVARSRALEPLFYKAPHPPNVQPRDYQFAGAEYALGRNNCLIGDEPGLGKTAQAIMISNALAAQRTLVVCPASLRLNWETEVWRWSTIPNVATYPVRKARDGISGEANYVIISYDLLRNPHIMAELLRMRWDHLILDEGHFFKDAGGNTRTRMICAPDMLPSVVGRITCLTGTPTPNGPIEIYNIARLLAWDCIDRMSVESFRDYYYDVGGGMVRGPVWDEDKKANVNKLHWSAMVRNVPRRMDELQLRLRKHIMVRRLKQDVLTELPPKTWSMIPLESTAAVKTALAHPGWGAVAELYNMDAAAFEHAGAPIEGEIATARRLLGEAKAPQVAAYVDDLLESGVQKVVVAAWHNSVMQVLADRLKRHGLVTMDARTSIDNRRKVVDRFQTDDSVRVFLGQTLVAGTGHTLTAASDVVLAEADWVPGVNSQMVDRCHRLGQRDAVTAHVPIVPGTLDERIIASSVDKAKHIYLAMDAA